MEFFGRRFHDDTTSVWTSAGEPLRWGSDEFRWTSNGLEWGHVGPGAYQLAFGLLLEHFGNANSALLHHQTLLHGMVCHLPRGSWKVTSNDINQVISGMPWMRPKEDANSAEPEKLIRLQTFGRGDRSIVPTWEKTKPNLDRTPLHWAMCITGDLVLRLVRWVRPRVADAGRPPEPMLPIPNYWLDDDPAFVSRLKQFADHLIHKYEPGPFKLGCWHDWSQGGLSAEYVWVLPRGRSRQGRRITERLTLQIHKRLDDQGNPVPANFSISMVEARLSLLLQQAGWCDSEVVEALKLGLPANCRDFRGYA